MENKQNTHLFSLVTFTVLAFAGVAAISACQQQSSAKPVSFKADIAPIISKNCLACHSEGGAGTRKSGIQLDSYENLMRAKVVTPGSVSKSPLLTVVLPTADHATSMPMRSEKLSKSQVQLIENWIAQGAKDN